MKKPTPIKKVNSSTDQSFLRVIFARLKLLPQKHLLFASILLHLFFFSLLFVHWEKSDPIKPIHIPKNISAHVVSADKVKVLQEQKLLEQRTKEKRQLEEKKKAEQRKKLQQQKALEKKKAKALALKKAAEAKKKAAAEKLKLKQKEQLTQKKREQEKLALQKKEEEKKRLEAERQKRLLEEKKIAEIQQQKIKEQENKLLEKLKKLEQEKLLEQQLEAENTRKEQAFLEYELSETEKFTFLIRSKIENLWRKPPKSNGLKVILRIRLLPNGELASVSVSESSGNRAFDNSAVLAVKSVRRYPVPEDSRIFESNFRQFNMSFSPETL